MINVKDVHSDFQSFLQ